MIIAIPLTLLSRPPGLWSEELHHDGAPSATSGTLSMSRVRPTRAPQSPAWAGRRSRRRRRNDVGPRRHWHARGSRILPLPAYADTDLASERPWNRQAPEHHSSRDNRTLRDSTKPGRRRRRGRWIRMLTEVEMVQTSCFTTATLLRASFWVRRTRGEGATAGNSFAQTVATAKAPGRFSSPTGRPNVNPSRA